MGIARAIINVLKLQLEKNFQNIYLTNQIGGIEQRTLFSAEKKVLILRKHLENQTRIGSLAEKYPGYKQRFISNNGSQFNSKDFAEYLKFIGLQDIRTSIAYQQSKSKIECYYWTLSRRILNENFFGQS